MRRRIIGWVAPFLPLGIRDDGLTLGSAPCDTPCRVPPTHGNRTERLDQVSMKAPLKDLHTTHGCTDGQLHTRNVHVVEHPAMKSNSVPNGEIRKRHSVWFSCVRVCRHRTDATVGRPSHIETDHEKAIRIQYSSWAQQGAHHLSTSVLPVSACQTMTTLSRDALSRPHAFQATGTCLRSTPFSVRNESSVVTLMRVSSGWYRNRRQRCREISFDILDVLEADRNTHQIRCHPCSCLLLLGKLLVGCR